MKQSCHPKVMLDLPPGGLRTLTEVVAFPVGRIDAWLWSLRGAWGATGATVCFCWCLGSSQASEKLLLPPGAWCTFTEVVPSPCFECSIANC